ncbi:MAG: purN [Ilumatobacteraceae bacterium]|nr:purN [Ilumatobacteraceae bacterium]
MVLASGNGSNFQALIDASTSRPPKAATLAAEIVGLVVNRPDAYALERAAASHIPAVVLAPLPGEARADYDTRLADVVSAMAPDLVVLAGWMRLLSMPFLSRFPRRVINLHPALPGQFPGTHAIERALESAQRSEIDHTGVMVHYVPDEGVDDGPVISTASVVIHRDDTVDTLADRVHAAERLVLVSAVREALSDVRRPGAPTSS